MRGGRRRERARMESGVILEWGWQIRWVRYRGRGEKERRLIMGWEG